jgi:hypothetical protein
MLHAEASLLDNTIAGGSLERARREIQGVQRTLAASEQTSDLHQ